MTSKRQAKVLARSESIARTAYRHSCCILLGCAQKPTVEAQNATGTFVLLSERHYVITADHVLRGYRDRLKEESHVHFQIGDVRIEPFERLVYRHKDDDLAVLAIDGSEVGAIGAPYRPTEPWPPAPPTVGQLMQLCALRECIGSMIQRPKLIQRRCR